MPETPRPVGETPPPLDARRRGWPGASHVGSAPESRCCTLLSEVSALFITTLHPSVEAAGGDVEGEHILAPVLQRQTRPGGTGADVEHTSRSQVEGDVRVSREVLDGVGATDEAVRTLDQLVRGDRDSTRFLTGPRTSPKVPIVSCFVWTRSFTIGRRWRRHWSTQPDFRPPQSTSVVRSRRRTSAVTPFRLTTSAPLPGRGEFAFADGDPRSGRPLASCITNVRTLVRARPKHFAESLCCRS